MKTKLLRSDEAGIEAAAHLLRAGEVVSFPTETVYGLGGDACNDLAVAKIFEAKGRPSFNPLIVHVNSINEAQRLAQWSDIADDLAKAFWPGPLTLVLPLRPDAGLSHLVSAGLPSVALRWPAHPLANILIEAFGGPLAAPSANPSGRISPTTSGHVIDGLSGQIAAILDGSGCDVGLESTIIGLINAPTLLRPGGLSQEVLEHALGAALNVHQTTDEINAPGQLMSHYAPLSAMRLNATDVYPNEVLLGFGNVAAKRNLSPESDLTQAAANLFLHLHELDTLGHDVIAVSPIPNKGIGRAINDRLRRAAAPR